MRGFEAVVIPRARAYLFNCASARPTVVPASRNPPSEGLPFQPGSYAIPFYGFIES